MKKASCIVLALVMILSLMTGCGGQKPPETTGEAAVTTPVDTQAPATEAGTAETPADTSAEASADTPTEATTEKTTDTPTEPPTEVLTEPAVPPEGSAARAYQDAVASLPADYRLTVEWEMSRAMGKELMITTEKQLREVRGAGTDAMKVSESWERSIEGNAFRQDVSYQWYFNGGKTLLLRENQYYMGQEKAEDYLARRIPLAMLSLDKYDSVQWEDESQHRILFTEAQDTEWEWLGMDCTDIKEVRAQVELDEEGRLVKTVYTALYALEGIEFSVHVTATLEENSESLAFPEIPSQKIIRTGDVFAIPLMDTAACCFYTDGITADMLAFIQAYAVAAVVLDQLSIGLDADAEGPMLYERDSRSIYSMETDKFTAEYRHFGGKTSYRVEEQEWEPDRTPQEMEAYLTDRLTRPWPLPETLRNLVLRDEEDCWLIEMELSEEGVTRFRESVEPIVFNAETTTESLGISFRTNVCKMYISVDKGSGLPVHTGTNLSGNHLYMGESYLFDAAVEWNYLGANPEAASTIRDEIDKGTAPEEMPTPLFYHITAPEGGQMWMLGTIHVGDKRSSWLPDKIYEALLSADALAVEIDTDSMEERMEEDEGLALQYQMAVLYLNGSTVFDHLGQEQGAMLETALKKYGGEMMAKELSYNVGNMTAYLEQLMLPLGRLHSYERGVDNQLVKLAKDNQIPVWEVEDLIEHISLLGGYSDELQELLLVETLKGGRYGSNMSTVELFDLWCRGDEAELESKLFEEDKEDMTEEERALMEEYEQGMLTKRNAQMVEKAKEYMASGKTVFFAVGLAHLLGEDGLVKCLREAGYSVEQVVYP